MALSGTKLAKMYWILAALVPFVAAQGAGSSLTGLEAMLNPGRKMMEARLQEVAIEEVEKRQTPGTNETNMATWDADTSAACMEALSQLTLASNPSGTAVCYNLPSLDTTAGTFMADLRLFQISAPSGDFAGIDQRTIAVVVQYNGASFSDVTKTVNARDVAAPVIRRQTSGPTLLQTYTFVGQIDSTQMDQTITMGLVESWVLPIVTLSAQNTSGSVVSTNVSTNEAAFVAGVFSDQTVLSDFAIAQLAVSDMTNQLKNGTVAFVLPGVTLMIFPTGLIVTGLWTVLGVAAYGFGTYQRHAYRSSYRRRKAIASGKPSSARI